MKVLQFEETTISGISIRTTNAEEMNSNTAQIGPLHQRFDENVIVNYQCGSRVYGVYFDYESDASGEFSVLAGADQIESSNLTLEQITLPGGKYLVFMGKGEMPQAVLAAWGQIWNYFAGTNPEFQRAFTTDFEFYKSQDEVEIYIAIKPS